MGRVRTGIGYGLGVAAVLGLVAGIGYIGLKDHEKGVSTSRADVLRGMEKADASVIASGDNIVDETEHDLLHRRKVLRVQVMEECLVREPEYTCIVKADAAVDVAYPLTVGASNEPVAGVPVGQRGEDATQ